jgi:hypothetical protein
MTYYIKYIAFQGPMHRKWTELKFLDCNIQPCQVSSSASLHQPEPCCLSGSGCWHSSDHDLSCANSSSAVPSHLQLFGASRIPILFGISVAPYFSTLKTYTFISRNACYHRRDTFTCQQTGLCGATGASLSSRSLWKVSQRNEEASSWCIARTKRW